jgi:hypothetical protein
VSVRFYDYSVAKTYQYEGKSSFVTKIEKLINPFAVVFGSRVVNVSKMEIGEMAPLARRVLYVALLIAVLPYTLFCAICLLIKYIMEPPSKVLEILRDQMKVRESEISDFVKAFKFEEALDLFESSRNLINLFSQYLIRREFRSVIRTSLREIESARQVGDVERVFNLSIGIDKLVDPESGILTKVGLDQKEVDYINQQHISEKNFECAGRLIREVDIKDIDACEAVCKLCSTLNQKQSILAIYLDRYISHLFEMKDLIHFERVSELLHNVMGMHYLTSEGNVFSLLLRGVLRVVPHERYSRNIFRVIVSELLDPERECCHLDVSTAEVGDMRQILDTYVKKLAMLEECEKVELEDVDIFEIAFKQDRCGFGNLEDFILNAMRYCETLSSDKELLKQISKAFEQFHEYALNFSQSEVIDERSSIIQNMSALNVGTLNSQGLISPKESFSLSLQKFSEVISQEQDREALERAQEWLCILQSVFQEEVDVYNTGHVGLIVPSQVFLHKSK